MTEIRMLDIDEIQSLKDEINKMNEFKSNLIGQQVVVPRELLGYFHSECELGEVLCRIKDINTYYEELTVEFKDEETGEIKEEYVLISSLLLSDPNYEEVAEDESI